MQKFISRDKVNHFRGTGHETDFYFMTTSIKWQLRSMTTVLSSSQQSPVDLAFWKYDWNYTKHFQVDNILLNYEELLLMHQIFQNGTRLNPFARSWFYNATAVHGASGDCASHSVNYANHQHSPGGGTTFARRRHGIVNSIFPGIIW